MHAILLNTFYSIPKLVKFNLNKNFNFKKIKYLTNCFILTYWLTLRTCLIAARFIPVT